MGGLAAMYAWRSVYWSEQVSMRTRALLMIDWVVRCVPKLSRVIETEADLRHDHSSGVWGRDLSRL